MYIDVIFEYLTQESCGFKTHGERTQVYRLMENHGNVCLAGTSEMSLGGKGSCFCHFHNWISTTTTTSDYVTEWDANWHCC